MNDQLLEKCLAELRRSGHAVEMEVAHRISALNFWTAYSGGAYADADSGILREIDLHVVGGVGRDVVAKGRIPAEVEVSFSFAVEVKWSKDKPFMLLREVGQQTRPSTFDAARTLGVAENYVGTRASLWAVHQSTSLVAETGWLAYGVRDCRLSNATSRSDSNERDRSYLGAISAIKAAYSYYRADVAAAAESRRSRSANEVSYRHHRPVVVLRGDLLAASIDSDGELHVEPVRFGSCRMFLESAAYARRACVVDFVTFEGLEDYFALQHAAAQTMLDHVVTQAERHGCLPESRFMTTAPGD